MRLALRMMLCVVCVPAFSGAAAQGPPGTDIWLAPLTVRDGRVTLGAPRNLTRRAGYDNQPGWSPRGDIIYYTSNRDGEQTDIYRIAVASGDTARVTSTPESEYSATAIENGAALSVVRVERDSAQRLWRMPLGGGAPSVILPGVRPVGYHAWADARTLGLFVLGQPATFRVADAETGAVRIVAGNIGRGVAAIPGTARLSFIEKRGANDWWVMSYDAAANVLATVAPTLAGVEDYAWTPGGMLLMARESRVYAWSAARREWEVVADLAAAGVVGMTRLAASPRGDFLAIVARDQVP